MSLATSIENYRTKLATKANKFMPDLCTLIPAVLSTQGDGHTLAEGTPVPNVPCTHKQLGGGGVQVNDNGTVVTKTHSVELPYTSATVLIDRDYKIKVAARGFNAETIFELPVRPVDSLSPFLEVLATLSEGFREPGVT